MSWQTLQRFRDRSVPKLNNLRRADDAGLRVPATVWASAANLAAAGSLPGPPSELGAGPWIIRSGSPTEDTRLTSNAGQLLSLPAREAADFGSALQRVLDALPVDEHGRRRGVVFVQPLLNAEEAGVAFFDGFYFERTQAQGGNEGLTSGQTRGEVGRGHLARRDPWSDWLASIHAVFGAGADGDARLDVEFARDAAGYILLQVRPALFPLERNPTLSLANHKEILGDPPSPWMVSALVEAGQDLSFPAQADQAIRTWGEAYAVEAGERAWLNVSFWYRWMDRFGLPRTLVTEGVGGHADGPDDARILPLRFLASIPRLMWFQWCCLGTLPGLGRAFRRFDQSIEKAKGLPGLHAATAEGLTLALRGNFAINAALSGISRIRRLLRLGGAARVVTQDMMEEYSRLRSVPPADRESAIDQWLSRYGHRGPLESDLARPRFAELRDVLLHDLTNAACEPTGGASAAPNRPSSLLRPFYWIDERREWFRDEMMRRWQRLRARILEEGRRLVSIGDLDAVEDVFWLRRSDLNGMLPLRETAAAGKTRVEAVRHIDLPQSAPLDVIQGLLTQAARAQSELAGRKVFPGIPLNPAVVEGRAVKADDLVTLLRGTQPDSLLGPDVILVVPTLEPSWAVVFGRVGGVVAELGGELSHASILLRESRRPAIVNCAGVFREVRTGARLRLDGARGLVELLDDRA